MAIEESNGEFKGSTLARLQIIERHLENQDIRIGQMHQANQAGIQNVENKIDVAKDALEKKIDAIHEKLDGQNAKINRMTGIGVGFGMASGFFSTWLKDKF